MQVVETLPLSCLGCGLSLLAEDMRDDGYLFLLGVDYSEACIKVSNPPLSCPRRLMQFVK